MAKEIPKFLFQIEMPDCDLLSVSEALKLTTSAVLKDIGTTSILNQHSVKPVEKILLDELLQSGITLDNEEAEDDYSDYIFAKSVMSAAQLAIAYPYETASERHEAVLFKMFRNVEIIFLDKFGQVDAKSDTNNIDRNETALSFSDFLNFSTAVSIAVVCAESTNSTVTEPFTTANPWLEPDPRDPEPLQPWYTSARYFARIHTLENPSLATKKLLLAEKVSKSLTAVGVYKRGGKKPLEAETILKAFSNVTLS